LSGKRIGKRGRRSRLRCSGSERRRALFWRLIISASPTGRPEKPDSSQHNRPSAQIRQPHRFVNLLNAIRSSLAKLGVRSPLSKTAAKPLRASNPRNRNGSGPNCRVPTSFLNPLIDRFNPIVPIHPVHAGLIAGNCAIRRAPFTASSFIRGSLRLLPKTNRPSKKGEPKKAASQRRIDGCGANTSTGTFPLMGKRSRNLTAGTRPGRTRTSRIEKVARGSQKP